MKSPIFLKKVNKQLKSADILSPILVQQKYGFNEITLKLSGKSRNLISKPLPFKRNFGSFHGVFPDTEFFSTS